MSNEIGSLGDASSAALAAIESGSVGSAPSTEAPASAAVDIPTTDLSVTPAPATPEEAKIPEFKGSKHKVKVRGTEEEVDYDELVKGYSRQADYTRSKQELADQMRRAQELEHSVKQAQASLQHIFGSDPLMQQAAEVAEAYKVPFSQALQAVIEHQRGTQVPQGAQTPSDQIATVEQAKAIAQQQLGEVQRQMALLQQQMKQATEQQINAAKTEIQTSHQAQEYAAEVNTVLGDIFSKNPVLEAVEGMEDLLRFKVYQADPATVEEAKDLFVRFASEQAEKLNARFTELNKNRLVQKEKLTSGGIEPPGGSGIVPQPTDHTFGSKGLRDSAEAYLKSMLR